MSLKQRHKYSKISDTDNDTGLHQSNLSNNTSALPAQPKSAASILVHYAHSVFWIITAILIITYSDLVRVVQEDSRISQNAFHLAIGGAFVNFAL